MPSLSVYRKQISGGMTVGQHHSTTSDLIMEATWNNDVQSKTCYIYDYFHDDQPQLNHGMTYEDTTKTKIDAKIMVTKYGSLSSDQPELHVMFKPSQLFSFDEDDELYYMEEYRKLYGSDIPIGMYIDIPDKHGVYHKHMICLKDVATPNFQKYFILPCDYNLEWIRRDGNKRIKQRMWCVLRSQSS